MKRFCLFLMMIFTLSAGAFCEIYKANAEASFYADKFHGRKTANGEIFNMYDYTAAHKTLPFNTILKVTNIANGKSVTVRVNDRGPFVQGREIDLSKAAAQKLDMIGDGTAQVSIEILQLGADTKISSVTAASHLLPLRSKIVMLSTGKSSMRFSSFITWSASVVTPAGMSRLATVACG